MYYSQFIKNFLQNDMKILKLTDVDFIMDQKYILTLKIPGKYFDAFYYDYSEKVKIGLFRIAQCSNYGK